MFAAITLLVLLGLVIVGTALHLYLFYRHCMPLYRYRSRRSFDAAHERRLEAMLFAGQQ